MNFSITETVMLETRVPEGRTLIELVQLIKNYANQLQDPERIVDTILIRTVITVLRCQVIQYNISNLAVFDKEFAALSGEDQKLINN
jgi:hypothetical protein